jgi:hypothetical protein
MNIYNCMYFTTHVDNVAEFNLLKFIYIVHYAIKSLKAFNTHRKNEKKFTACQVMYYNFLFIHLKAAVLR